MDTLKVAEIFGPTIQGEGPSTGRICYFVRLSGCNLTCSWCDTPFTWDWQGANGVAYDEAAESQVLDVAHVAELLQDAPRVVVTGGEPLMQQVALAALIGLLDVPVEIETNGTIVPSLALMGTQITFNVSPKLAHSGVRFSKRIKTPALDRLRARQSVFKFVAAAPSDVNEAALIAKTVGISNDRVWVMPLGATAPEAHTSLAAIAETAIGYGFNISTRLHVDLWGDERGR